MGMIKEFREFALKGNVIELAVAVVFGAAFNAIVSSLVADIITPLMLQPLLKAARLEDLEKLGWNGVKYGKFLAAVLNFLIVAFVLFLAIKGINRMKRLKEESAAPEANAAPDYTLQEKLLMEIRDSLKKNNE